MFVWICGLVLIPLLWDIIISLYMDPCSPDYIAFIFHLKCSLICSASPHLASSCSIFLPFHLHIPSLLVYHFQYECMCIHLQACASICDCAFLFPGSPIGSIVQFSSVTQSCLTLCDPMNCSMPGLPVHHQLPEFIQTRIHRVGDAIQPSHSLLSPSPPTTNPSQHQGLFQWVSSSHGVAKVLEFQVQHQSFQWTLRTDLL